VGTHHILGIVQEMRSQLPDYGLICLMGEMRELYDLTETAHRELAQKLIEMNIDYI
jgi:UDP-N-acetylmuramyl pentapeptide synthase